MIRRNLHARVLAILLPLSLAIDATAQDAPREPALPRVLLISDGSFAAHCGRVAHALKGRAEVVQSPLGSLHTGAALEQLKQLLQGKPWDVICCNFGLSDLMCRDPRTKAIRAMSPAAGGVPVTSLQDYRANLDDLVAGFRANGAKLIWLTTLPLSPQRKSSALSDESVASYNAAANERMRKHGVAVVDAYTQIQDLLAAAKNPRAVPRLHSDLLKRDLSAPLVARILKIIR